MARVRSPNYPQFSLAEAIKRVGPVFAKERQHPMPKDVLAKHLGYGGINGASLGAISALLKYGLISQDGESYRVADRALTILHPHNEAEKVSAIAAAAHEPALFAELTEHFKGGSPSDENLRAYLVRRGFAQSALTSVIQAFRETMALVPTDSSSVAPESTAVRGAGMQTTQQTRAVAGAPPSAVGMASPSVVSSESVLRVSVTDDRLEVSAALLDQKSVDRLIRVLEANKGLLPEDTDGDAGNSDSSN